MVERLFLAVPLGSLQFVIVVFPDHTHLLFLRIRFGILFYCFSELVPGNWQVVFIIKFNIYQCFTCHSIIVF